MGAMGRFNYATYNDLTRRKQLRSASEKQSIQQQQDHGADDGHDPAGDVILTPEKATDPGTNQCTGDAEQNRDDATTGISSRRQQLRNCADEKANKNDPDNRMGTEVHSKTSCSELTEARQGDWSRLTTNPVARRLWCFRDCRRRPTRPWLQLNHLCGANVFDSANFIQQVFARGSIEI